MALSISQMAAALGLTAGDLLELVQDNGGTLESRKVDLGTLKSWLQFKNNLTATADPGVNDDSTAGYEPGSKWLNTNTNEWFICSVAAAGAAVWEPLSLSADDLGSAALANTGTGPGDVPLNSHLGGAAYASFQGMPFPNMLPSSGRFADLAETFDYLVSNSTEPFILNSFFQLTNGATASECGKFIYNTSSLGGSAAALTATMSDLLAEMGVTNRFGLEYRICEFLAGAGTVGGISGGDGTKYPVYRTGGLHAFGAANSVTFAGWVRAVGAVAYFGRGGEDIWVNGVLQAAGKYELDPSEGWVHLRLQFSDTTGSNSYIGAMHTTQGNSIQLALPYLSPGLSDPGIYTFPQPSPGVFSV